MKTKADIKKIARKIFHKHRGRELATPRIMHPEREWFIGVSLSVICVIAVGVWSGTNYIQNRELIETGLTPMTVETVRYAEGSVIEALQIIERREQVVANFRNQAPTNPPTEVATTTVPVTTEIGQPDAEPGTASPTEAAVEEAAPPTEDLVPELEF